MKSFLSAAALWILLTPSLAQQVDQPYAEQAQQVDQPYAERVQQADQPYAEQAQQAPSMEAETAAQAEIQPTAQPSGMTQAGMTQAGMTQAGMTQAAAQLAAQAQADEEQNSAASPTAEQAPQLRPQPEEQQQAQPEEQQQAQPQQVQSEAQPEEQQQAQQPEAQPASPQDTAPQSGEQVQDVRPLEDTAQPSDTAQPADATQYSRRPPVQRRALEVSPAVRPRPEAAAYPVSRAQQQFSVGARLLSTKDVERKFSTPLGKHYLVVEVGLFPAGPQIIQLRPDNFTLRADRDDQAFFPTTPDDIASALSGSGSHNPRFYPSVGVGYGGGGWGRGVYTGADVAVAGRPYPRREGMAGGNRRVMENELRDKSLPEGSLTQPVAGYLYFPLSGKRSAHYNLELTRDGETLSLPLPAPND